MTVRLGSAPVSWGIVEPSDVPPYKRVLDEIADTGYQGTELGPWGYLPTEPDSLRAALESRRLQLTSAYVPVAFLYPSAVEAAEAHVLSTAALLAVLNAPTLILADDNRRVPELVARAGRRVGSALNREQWETYSAGVNRIARKVYDATGLKCVFHPQCAGYIETPEEVRHLMDRTDAARVGLCLDTGHCHYGGGDAVETIKEFGTRVRYLHLKDCDPSILRMAQEEKMDYFAAIAAGIFCELGKGAVDFEGVIEAMDTLHYDGWAIVEQDTQAESLDAPRMNARRNREYLRGLGV